MTDEETASLRYQFSGYQLPMIQLDETGPSYIVIPEPHPYYRNQPTYWSKPAYGGLSSNQGIIGDEIDIEESGNTGATEATQKQPGAQYNMIPIDFV